MAKAVPASVPVMVTGASSGIGAEFARRFAARGHDLTLVARRADRLAKLAKELSAAHGVSATPLAADLGEAADRARVATLLREKGPWILVNNAGYGTHGRFGEDLDPEREVAMVVLNCVAVTELAAAVLPRCLEERTGGLINLASTAAFQPVPFMSTYAATKVFNLHLSEGLAGEHRGSGVRIMALCPGATRTEFDKVANVGGEFELLMPMEVERCVGIAMRAFDRGQVICVPGALNTAGTVAARLAPRALVRRVIAPIFEPSNARGLARRARLSPKRRSAAGRRSR